MKNIYNYLILLLCLNLFTNTSYAALLYNSTLLMGPQSSHCFNGLGVPGACIDYEVPDSNYWIFDISGDRIFSEDERTGIEAGIDGGIILGSTQGIGYIDSSWFFNGATGNHYTQSPVTILTDDNDGNVVLNMSGFTNWWNNQSIELDTLKEVEGILTCGTTCENGDSFVLEALAFIPPSDYFGPTDRNNYLFHMEGTISSVPVPAAAWLFGSGIIGLASYLRRKK